MNHGFLGPTQYALTDKSNFIYIDRVPLMKQNQHMTNGEPQAQVLRSAISNP